MVTRCLRVRTASRSDTWILLDRPAGCGMRPGKRTEYDEMRLRGRPETVDLWTSGCHTHTWPAYSCAVHCTAARQYKQMRCGTEMHAQQGTCLVACQSVFRFPVLATRNVSFGCSPTLRHRLRRPLIVDIGSSVAGRSTASFCVLPIHQTITNSPSCILGDKVLFLPR
jgi:hypothetical protein